jgi:DNA-directed RNA polymerase specialized sigma24 family protein
MLKTKVINDALHKVLTEKHLTFWYAIRLAASQHKEHQDTYSFQYIKFLQSIGFSTPIGSDCTWLHNNFLDYLRSKKLLEPEVLLPDARTYKPDEFDFSDWDGIKKSIGF